MRLLIFAFAICITQMASSKESNTYSAAVVEYFPERFSKAFDLKETITKRVDAYIEILSNIEQDLDIIVYPESTLQFRSKIYTREDLIDAASIIPSVADKNAPCSESNGYNEYFVSLSCAAKKYRTYLSVDLIEKSPCVGSKCSDDKWNVYNTNVVFDRDGIVVASYRKYNLFGEHVNVPDEPMHTTFVTDFGVKFGIFICFDIMFNEPAMKLVEQGVKHFIFPLMWFSELPFLTAVQTQHMWSFENDVVLLASGANNPRSGSSGSGIYQGRQGPLKMYINGKEGTKVLVANVEKVWDSSLSVENPNADVNEDVDNLKLFYDDLTKYNSFNLDVDQQDYVIKVNDDFQCNFHVVATNTGKLSDKQSYVYKLVGYSGWRSFQGQKDGFVQVCAMVTCLDNSLSTCGHRIPSNQDTYPILFEDIKVEMKLKENKNSKQYPNAVLGDLKPLYNENFDWKKSEGSRVISLKKPRRFFMTFGIYGRVFEPKTMKINSEL
ncbi:PREDICTED: vanin-like protein 1 [Nicrophorus vespilloides]|uniref:Vanin-like protein 1 n=1 Tax=Nicrophorus vespilloides TaxID=110193 RepID=A0ABM1MUG2_NICVS|nr:PREDICTED: vanin-like protein 1 [Nicrophorus vespilloides]